MYQTHIYIHFMIMLKFLTNYCLFGYKNTHIMDYEVILFTIYPNLQHFVRIHEVMRYIALLFLTSTFASKAKK